MLAFRGRPVLSDTPSLNEKGRPHGTALYRDMAPMLTSS